MERDALELLQALAHELNSIFNLQIDDVIYEEVACDIWVAMFSAFCLGRGYTLDEYNNMLNEVFAGTDDRTFFIKTLFGEHND